MTVSAMAAGVSGPGSVAVDASGLHGILSTMENWTKSSFCSKGECVEVFRRPGGIVMLRDSESPEDIVYLTNDSWSQFLKGAKAGDFDAV